MPSDITRISQRLVFYFSAQIRGPKRKAEIFITFLQQYRLWPDL
jgi:hypothetical protein